MQQIEEEKGIDPSSAHFEQLSGPDEWITKQRPIGGKGDPRARIVIIGEAPGEQEMHKGFPFVGASGHELDKMLCDAGIIKMVFDERLKKEVPDYTGVYFTNVTLIRPRENKIENWIRRTNKRVAKGKNPTPKHWVEFRGWLVEPHVAEDAKRLIAFLQELKPTVVIALGNTPFWALCSEGITGKVGTWRGSTLLSDSVPDTKVLVTYHPAYILRQWQHRRMTVHDLRRAKVASNSYGLPDPGFKFLIRPTYAQTCEYLNAILLRLKDGPVKLTADIEGAQGKTLCVGVGISAKEAICIPILYGKGFYFPPDQRFIVHLLLRMVLMHPNALVTGQNIGFDTQFLVNDLLLYPRIFWDTMIGQNVLWPGTPKNLAYQASMYCKQYRYWKDDSEEFWKVKEIKNWDAIWFYNCEDCARTFEVQEGQELFLSKRNLRPQFDRLQNRTFPLIRKIMFRGVNVNKQAKGEMQCELEIAQTMAQAKVNRLALRELNIASPKQLQDYFYHDLRLPVQFGEAAKGEEARPTTDANALVELAEIEPLIRPLVKWINLYRSYNAGLTVCKADTESDGRWHSGYSLGLVETFRLSSSENPFGRGLNLTNISSGKDVKDGEDE